DLLLHVHVGVVVGGLHDVDHLVGQLAVVEGEEVGAIELGQFDVVDDSVHQLAHLAQLAGRCLVTDPELEHDPSRIHALVVVDRLREQVGVGTHDLLAAQTADACGFQTDMLDVAGDIAENHEVTDLKRLVDSDGKRGENVAEQRLHGQGNGDAAHTQAGHHGGDVYA